MIRDMIQVTAELLERRIQGPCQELRLGAPELARQLSAGQAVLVRTGWGSEPFLRRTLYPIAIDDATWTLRLPPSGDWGHAWLRAAPCGTEIDCLGPVGRGYALERGIRNVFFAGEGEAAWALLPALVQADGIGLSTAFALQSISAHDIIPSSRLPASVEYQVATVNGRYGHPGQATTFLDGWLAWADAVLAAGSTGFYNQLADAIKTVRFALSRGYAQILYQATFFCGIGACQACVADLASGRRRACLRGPVFDLADLVMAR
jgi:dihydroorotate dehydrogenase electron transfer subunit